MPTLQQLRERRKELELMRYRKSRGIGQSTLENPSATKAAVEWIDSRLAAIDSEIKQRGGK